MSTANTSKQPLTNDEVIARAERAMARASEKAMADYKRFGIDPVISNPSKKPDSRKP